MQSNTFIALPLIQNLNRQIDPWNVWRKRDGGDDTRYISWSTTTWHSSQQRQWMHRIRIPDDTDHNCGSNFVPSMCSNWYTTQPVWNLYHHQLTTNCIVEISIAFDFANIDAFWVEYLFVWLRVFVSNQKHVIFDNEFCIRQNTKPIRPAKFANFVSVCWINHDACVYVCDACPMFSRRMTFFVQFFSLFLFLLKKTINLLFFLSVPLSPNCSGATSQSLRTHSLLKATSHCAPAVRKHHSHLREAQSEFIIFFSFYFSSIFCKFQFYSLINHTVSPMENRYTAASVIAIFHHHKQININFSWNYA